MVKQKLMNEQQYLESYEAIRLNLVKPVITEFDFCSGSLTG